MSRSVLVVDDRPVEALGLLCALAALGHTPVGPAYDSAQALLRLARDLPDAVIVSLDLRDGNPFSVANAADTLDIPVLFATRTTAYALPGRYAAHAALPKPCRPAQVEAGLLALGRGFHD